MLILSDDAAITKGIQSAGFVSADVYCDAVLLFVNWKEDEEEEEI